MAWTTPPTFADGDYLTATNLNILSDDLEYLKGRADQVNPAFYVQTLYAGDNVEEEKGDMKIRHRHNTLTYTISTVTGTIDYLKIYYNSVAILDDQTDRTNPYTYSGTIDLTSQGLTVGTFYGLSVKIRGKTGSATNGVEIRFIGEIP